MNTEESSVIELYLCETEHVMLRPNQLYRFVAKDDCARCQEMARIYREYGPQKES